MTTKNTNKLRTLHEIFAYDAEGTRYRGSYVSRRAALRRAKEMRTEGLTIKRRKVTLETIHVCTYKLQPNYVSV